MCAYIAVLYCTDELLFAGDVGLWRIDSLHYCALNKDRPTFMQLGELTQPTCPIADPGRVQLALAEIESQPRKGAISIIPPIASLVCSVHHPVTSEVQA